MEGIQISSVKVALRVRPLAGAEFLEEPNCISYPYVNQISMSERNFSFDFVFSEDCSTEKVYNDAVSPLEKAFLQGYNCTVFAYGQTGSGKTFTMGTDITQEGIEFSPENNAIIPLCTKAIFREKNEIEAKNCSAEREQVSFCVSVSFCEVYNNSIKDLIDISNDNLQIRERGAEYSKSNKKELKIAGLSEVKVRSSEELLRQLQKGVFNRTTGSTNVNTHSSRSHAIFTVTLKRTTSFGEESEREVIQSKFHFVDLAGSERQKKTKSTGLRLKESVEINTGLLALGNVISALGKSDRKSVFVPFRDSKITRLLEDSLGGNSKTLMIACVTPSQSHINESLSTLKYADRAKKIKNRPVINKDLDSSKIVSLLKRIEELESIVRNYEEGSCVMGKKNLNNPFIKENEENNNIFKQPNFYENDAEPLASRPEQVELERDSLKSKYDPILKSICKDAFDSEESCCSSDSLLKEFLKKVMETYLKEKEIRKPIISPSNNSTDKYKMQKQSNRELSAEKLHLEKLLKVIKSVFEKAGTEEYCQEMNEIISKTIVNKGDKNHLSKKEIVEAFVDNIERDSTRKLNLIDQVISTRKENEKLKENFENKILEMKREVSQLKSERKSLTDKLSAFGNNQSKHKGSSEIKKNSQELRNLKRNGGSSNEDKRIIARMKSQMEEMSYLNALLRRKVKEESLKFTRKNVQIQRELKEQIKIKKVLDRKMRKLQISVNRNHKLHSQGTKCKSANEPVSDGVNGIVNEPPLSKLFYRKGQSDDK